MWPIALVLIFWAALGLAMILKRKPKKRTPVVTATEPPTPIPVKPEKIQIKKVAWHNSKTGISQLMWRVIDPNPRQYSGGEYYRRDPRYADSYFTARVIAQEFIKEQQAVYAKELLAYNPNGIDHWTNHV